MRKLYMNNMFKSSTQVEQEKRSTLLDSQERTPLDGAKICATRYC